MLITEDLFIFIYFKSSWSTCRAFGQLPRSITRGVTWSFSLVFLGRGTVRNSSGTLTFFILSRFLGRNSSEISLSDWHLVIFRAEKSKKAPCVCRHMNSRVSWYSLTKIVGPFLNQWEPDERPGSQFGLRQVSARGAFPHPASRQHLSMFPSHMHCPRLEVASGICFHRPLIFVGCSSNKHLSEVSLRCFSYS